MMQIAMLGHKRVPSREGGIEVVVEELGVRMVEMGHEVTCYNRMGRHSQDAALCAAKQNIYRGLKIKTVPAIDIKGIAAMTASFFAAICAAFGRYDVVHFHAEGPCAMLWLPKLFGKRCIATVHGLDHKRLKWGRFARSYILLGEKCAAKFADEIIVLNHSNQEYFLKKYGRKTHCIPNGVNQPAFCEAQEITEKYGLHKDDYLLYLGRIVPEKKIDDLIYAFRKVKTDKKLVIAGGVSNSDSYYRELRQAAEGDSRIIFTGFVEGRTLEELYSNSYLYVLPSELEGMPLSLLEAMSYGNCCVVSDISENVEVVCNRGLSFKQGDALELRKKLQHLCDSPDEVKKYRSEAAEYVCNRFGWDDVVSQTLKVYSGE